ncbi:hypothetical protein SAMN05216359_1125 [Roseateles sp. YR242]|uniref:hypothetical protein n=1 Tax=Roseateles sp. YR242 TaxID=1855305 RepID=UPI0008BFEBC1|nr:hypothetical protein [Roseateles sp. YR242]SEL60215.1 hypothetical protein SAMN05216359_1125 [Roseateles sp. YR242]
MAIGNVEKFSWSAVGQSALAAGVSAGVAYYVPPIGGASAAASTANAANAAATVIPNFPTTLMRAGLSSAVTQAVQGKWSWREVGASVVSAGAGYYAGQAMQ